MCNDYFIFEGEKKKLKFSSTVTPGGGGYFVNSKFYQLYQYVKRKCFILLSFGKKKQKFYIVLK